VNGAFGKLLARWLAVDFDPLLWPEHEATLLELRWRGTMAHTLRMGRPPLDAPSV
jgi:hypothetical protein